MKSYCNKLFLLTIILSILILPSALFAVVDPAVRTASLPLQAESFDEVLKVTVVTLDAAAAITADDVVSTYTEAVYMLPDNVRYPIKLRIQNHGTASLTYVEYDTSATGLVIPTATASHLVTPAGASVTNGAVYEKVFFRKPNISIGASGDQEVIIEVWGRKNTE